MSRRKKTEPKQKFYFLMNKALGDVCSAVSDRRKTVYERLSEEIKAALGDEKLHTIGRLDAESGGLLLLTNDGKLSNFLTRPENKIEKTYLVRLERAVSFDEMEEYGKLALKGVLLPPEKKCGEQQGGKAVIKWKTESKNDGDFCDECEITVTEGKFHEVRRIFRALGNEVISLKRIRFAEITLDENLSEGEVRPLTEKELESLKDIISR